MTPTIRQCPECHQYQIARVGRPCLHCGAELPSVMPTLHDRMQIEDFRRNPCGPSDLDEYWHDLERRGRGAPKDVIA